MKEYKARMVLSFTAPGVRLVKGDKVTVVYEHNDRTYLIRLPKKFHGKGHTGFSILGKRFRANNYLWVYENSFVKEEIK